MKAKDIQIKLKALGSPEVKAIALRFFKTGPGDYGEGDRFHGIKVPVIRRVVGEYRDLAFPEIKRLLASPFHEDRFAALDIMARQFKRGDEATREKIYRLYIGSARWINNWDLVDVSAPHILGAYLEARDRAPLYTLAQSKHLWERRMAIVATLRFVRKKDSVDALRIAKLLLAAPEDLLHKAVGWVLREVGKRDRHAEEAFLVRHYRTMPRTMLRYAIEHFSEPRRQDYLKGRV